MNGYALRRGNFKLATQSVPDRVVLSDLGSRFVSIGRSIGYRAEGQTFPALPRSRSRLVSSFGNGPAAAC